MRLAFQFNSFNTNYKLKFVLPLSGQCLNKLKFDCCKMFVFVSLFLIFIIAAKDVNKYNGSGYRENDKTILEHTTAVVVRRGMRGMSSMGRPAIKSNSESNSVLSQMSNAKIIPTITASTGPVNEFVCACPTGWTGPTCEISKLHLILLIFFFCVVIFEY